MIFRDLDIKMQILELSVCAGVNVYIEDKENKVK